MATATATPTRSSDSAALRIPLTPEVNARQLAWLLESLDEVYLVRGVLDRAIAGQFAPRSLEQALQIRESDYLVIARLEIGTPNFLTLKGVKGQVIAAATFLSTVLGVPVAGTEAYQNYQEAELNRHQAVLTQVETIREARDLLNRGIITRKLYLQVTGIIEDAEKKLGNAQHIVSADEDLSITEE